MTIANSIVLTDNGFGTIGASLAVTDTALTFTTGHGARFPVVAAGQVLYCCLLNSNNVLEEIQITAHASGADSATMVRGAGSTTAKTWNSGDRIEARISSTALKRLQDEALKETTLSTADGGATYTGAMDVPGLGYVTGLVYAMKAPSSNSGANPTIALDGLSAIVVKLDGGGALVANQMPANGLYAFDGTNFILLNPFITTAATAAADTNSTAIATTAFVLGQSASQADLETSSSTTKFTSAGRQQFHPSAAKAWARGNFVGGLFSSYNVASITDSGIGQQAYNWTVSFSSTNYIAVATSFGDPGGAPSGTFATTVAASGFGTGTVTVYTLRVDTGAGSDTSGTSVVAFGDQ